MNIITLLRAFRSPALAAVALTAIALAGPLNPSGHGLPVAAAGQPARGFTGPQQYHLRLVAQNSGQIVDTANLDFYAGSANEFAAKLGLAHLAFGQNLDQRGLKFSFIFTEER